MYYAARWYSYKELCDIARVVRQMHHSGCKGTWLCDRGPKGRVLRGGYGMNVRRKLSPFIEHDVDTLDELLD